MEQATYIKHFVVDGEGTIRPAKGHIMVYTDFSNEGFSNSMPIDCKKIFARVESYVGSDLYKSSQQLLNRIDIINEIYIQTQDLCQKLFRDAHYVDSDFSDKMILMGFKKM